MFHLELSVDFDRGFSSGFSPPDIFRPFSVFGHTHKVSKSVTKSVSCHRKTQDKKSATKSVAKSVPLGRKIHRKIRHSHQKNPPQFHSAETCALVKAVEKHAETRLFPEEPSAPKTQNHSKFLSGVIRANRFARFARIG